MSVYLLAGIKVEWHAITFEGGGPSKNNARRDMLATPLKDN
jgi:hypothetical protein